MENPAPASFWTQTNALLRKNLTFQKRNVKTNLRLILFPLILCVLLVVLQALIDRQMDKPEFKCGCVCANNKTQDAAAECNDSEKVCGVQYSDSRQAVACAIPHPPEWPPLLQLPARPNWTGFLPLCMRTGSCPFTMLFTANNHSFAESVSENLFPSEITMNDSDIMASLATNVLGSESWTERNNFLEPAFSSGLPIYYLQTRCLQNSGFSFPFQIAGNSVELEFRCAQGLHSWRNSSSEINNELYKGYKEGNPDGQINDIVSDLMSAYGTTQPSSVTLDLVQLHCCGFLVL